MRGAVREHDVDGTEGEESRIGVPIIIPGVIMQQMICITAVEYRQRPRKPGETFDVDDAHVEVLKLTGKARLPAGEPQTEGTLHVKRKYTRREAA